MHYSMFCQCSPHQEGGDQSDREREALEVQEAGGGERGETTPEVEFVHAVTAGGSVKFFEIR